MAVLPFFFCNRTSNSLSSVSDSVIWNVKMVNFGKKLMADQVEEWKGYDFPFGTYEMIFSFIFSGKGSLFHMPTPLGYINTPYRSP